MMEMEEFLKMYPWSSEDHKKSFLGLVQHIGNLPSRITQGADKWLILAAFTMNESKHAYEHTRDMVGDQLSSLRKEIHNLNLELGRQRRINTALAQAQKLQVLLTQTICKNLGMKAEDMPPGAPAMFSSLPETPKA